MEPLEYERGLLSICLQGRSAWAMASEVILSESFYQQANQKLWAVLSDHFRAGGDDNFLEIKNKAEAAGIDADLLLGLLTVTFPGDNPDFWINGVNEAWRKREWFRIGMTAANKTKDGQTHSEEIEAFILKEMQNIASRTRRKAETICDVMKRVTADALTKEIEVGLTTGFPTLDAELKGFEPGQLILIASRTSVGKTTFGFNIAAHVALTLKRRVLAFSSR